MLPQTIKDAVYDAIPKQFDIDGKVVTAKVIYADQRLSKPEYPLIVLGYDYYLLDKGNTPANLLLLKEYVDAGDGYQDVKYVKGVRMLANLSVNVYDTDIRRCNDVAAALFLWALRDLRATLEQHGAGVRLPSRINELDEFEGGSYLRRRQFDVQILYAVTWEEFVKTIETVEYETEVEG